MYNSGIRRWNRRRKKSGKKQNKTRENNTQKKAFCGRLNRNGLQSEYEDREKNGNICVLVWMCVCTRAIPFCRSPVLPKRKKAQKCKILFPTSLGKNRMAASNNGNHKKK
jgi:hypothetical protein